MMKIGAHVSIAAGIHNAPINAHKLSCESFQFFSGAPQRWPQEQLDKESIDTFLKHCEKYGYELHKDYVIHAPYLINLASQNNRIFYGSVNALKKELVTASALKAPYVITHIGSAKDCIGLFSEDECNALVMKAIKKIHEGYKGSTMLVLEIAAGSGNIIGDTFEEIAIFLKEGKKAGIPLGFCFDTCHSFAAGYDLSTVDAVHEMFEKMDKVIGIENLKVAHFNDSRTELNSRKDQHEHIGKGKIGETGLAEVARILKGMNINVIIETNHDKIKEDISLVKSFRDAR